MGLPPSTSKVVGVRNRLESLWKLYEGYITDIKYIKQVYRAKNSEMMERCIDKVPMRHWQKLFDIMDSWTTVWDNLLYMVESIHLHLSCLLSTHPRVWEILWRAHKMYFFDFWTEKTIVNVDTSKSKRFVTVVHNAAELCRRLPHFTIAPTWEGGMCFSNEQGHFYIPESFKAESFTDIHEKMDLLDQKADQEELLYQDKFDIKSATGIGVPGFPYHELRYAKDPTWRSSKSSSKNLNHLQNRPEGDDLGPSPRARSRFVKCFQDLALQGQLPI
ncbi:hypothetical protein LQW54_012222 [Pestalotiopsis sp. IQ-011]